MMRLHVNSRFTNKLLRIAVAGSAFIAGGILQSAQNSGPGLPPAAKQIGVSCGFFANVPALTMATGVDIHTSEPFVRSIFGLRRGDFSYRSSFDKRMFYELFALPYVETRISHPPGSPQTALENSRHIITRMFHDGLEKGRIFSLRVRGIFNGPHNALLIGRRGDRYILHDPFPGTIEEVGLDQLATRMLVRSTLKKNRGKVVYVTHYLTIDLPPRPRGKVMPVNSLPTSLEISLSASQRKRIATMLHPPRKPAPDAGIGGFIAAFPHLDFAALPDAGENGKARNVIGEDLKAKDLVGLLNLAKFTLNIWEQKRRPLLPVVVMDGQPQVLIGYRAADPVNPTLPTLVFDDGINLRSFTPAEALDRIRKNGAIVATLNIEYD
jgi:hypothetical protein